MLPQSALIALSQSFWKETEDPVGGASCQGYLEGDPLHVSFRPEAEDTRALLLVGYWQNLVQGRRRSLSMQTGHGLGHPLAATVAAVVNALGRHLSSILEVAETGLDLPGASKAAVQGRPCGSLKAAAGGTAVPVLDLGLHVEGARTHRADVIPIPLDPDMVIHVMTLLNTTLEPGDTEVIVIPQDAVDPLNEGG